MVFGTTIQMLLLTFLLENIALIFFSGFLDWRNFFPVIRFKQTVTFFDLKCRNGEDVSTVEK